MKLKNTKIYVDIDGVLADFIAGIKKIIPNYDEYQYQTDSKYRDDTWNAVADYTKSGGQLWLELPVMDDAIELWEFVKPHSPEILSATGRGSFGARPQKKEWIRIHVDPNVKVNLITATRKKATYATSGDILIDDRLKAIAPWRAAGGIGILHTTAKQTIKELKQLGY